MAISGPGPLQGSPRPITPLRFNRAQGFQGPSESGGARLVTVGALQADIFTLRSSPSDAKHLVARQGQVAMLITGQSEPNTIFPLQLTGNKTGERSLPSLSEYASYFKPPERPQLSLFDTLRPGAGRFDFGRGDNLADLLNPQRPGRNQRPQIRILDPSARGSRSSGLWDPLQPRRGLDPFNLNTGRDSNFEFRKLFRPARTETSTFGNLGPFSLRRPLEIGKPQLAQNQAPVDLNHLLTSPAPQSFAQATNAVGQGREAAINEARQMALGDPRAVHMFRDDADRAFGEKLAPDQVRRGAVEVLAHNPDPSLVDYQLLEGSVLKSKEPLKDFPMASLAVSRAIAFDHGGVREHMREAVQSDNLPIESRRQAASFLGSAFPSFANQDIQVLQRAASDSPDKKLRTNATHSLLAGLDFRVQKPHPGLDEALEKVHLKDSQRAEGGDERLRGQIEEARLRVFEGSKGTEKDRLARSLFQEQNRDETRVHVFDHLHASGDRSLRAHKAAELAREFTDPNSRNALLTKHAPSQFRGENDRLAGTLGSAKPDAEKQTAIRLLAHSPMDTLSEQTFAKAKEFTKQHGDAATRRAMLDKMPEGPLSRSDLEKAGAATKAKITEALGSAEGGDLGKLANLYKARALVKGEFKGEAYPGALAKIDKEIEAFQKKDSVQKQFRDIAQKARNEALGGRDLGTEQAKYLGSENFIERLEVAGPDLANTMLKAEMMKLQSLDPNKAKTAADELTRKLTERQGQKNWVSLDAKAREEVVRKGLLTVRDELKNDKSEGGKALSAAIGAGSTSNKVVQKLAQTMQEVSKDSGKLNSAGEALKKLSRQAQQLQNAMNSGDKELIQKLTAKYGELGVLKKSANLIQKLESNGKLGSLGAAVGIHSLMTGGVKFHDFGSSVNTLGSFGSVAAGTDDVLKLTGWLAGKVPKGAATGAAIGSAGKALGSKLAFKMLGPIGDSLNAVSTGTQFVDQVSGGDGGAAFVSGLATLGYTGAAATGLYAIVTGVATGPPGWIALGLGAAAWGVNSIFGESEQEALLRRQLYTADGKQMRLLD